LTTGTLTRLENPSRNPGGFHANPQFLVSTSRLDAVFGYESDRASHSGLAVGWPPAVTRSYISRSDLRLDTLWGQPWD
jgi:hypothetical protein